MSKKSNSGKVSDYMGLLNCLYTAYGGGTPQNGHGRKKKSQNRKKDSVIQGKCRLVHDDINLMSQARTRTITSRKQRNTLGRLKSMIVWHRKRENQSFSVPCLNGSGGDLHNADIVQRLQNLSKLVEKFPVDS